MLTDSSSVPPLSGDDAAKRAATPATTFKPLLGAHGPSHDEWLQYLVYIRGAAAALRFGDVDLTERMRTGFDSDAAALDSVHAWAETEHHLLATIELLRTAQARCTLAAGRVGTRVARQVAGVSESAPIPLHRATPDRTAE